MENKRHRVRLVIYSSITAVIMLLIFLFSAQHGDGSQNLSDGFLKTLIGDLLSRILPRFTGDFGYDIRKYAHMFEYFCLGISSSLLFWEIFIGTRRRAIKATGAAEAFSFLYACSDEFHQLFVPERAGKFSDVRVDSVGFSLAAVLMLVIFCIYLHFLDKEDRSVYHKKINLCKSN